ncbi:MAG TPA: ribosome small subunit-dependent GTPase A [Longimicrobiaceae bacterium]|nr:ribosome small subunit-dependent GTPase A [Longimicrobiaceae bacterium]
MTGRVLRAQGGTYEVETEGGTVEAALRGRLKREERTGDRVVVGDLVEVEPAGDTWTIERVHPRRTALVRRAPGKAPRAKIIVANVDQVVIVFAAAHPAPHLRMLDRFLVICESSGLEPRIVVNKTDLAGAGEVRALFGRYHDAGYPVLYTAARQGAGIEALREALCGSVSALTGPSGVGKSSLLNALQPGLGLRVAAVSEAVNKGRHTTVTAQLIPLECGGYVADTPGLREVGLWGVDPEELDGYFPEFRPYLGTCRYGNSCTHTHEPGCAVRAAAGAGEIHPERYESYQRIFRGDDDWDT